MALKTLGFRSLPKVTALPTPVAGLEGVTAELSSDKKPYYCDGATWVDLSATGSGAGLTYTTIKTSNFGPTVGTVVRVNSTGGAFTVTLPTTPADGSVVGVFDVANYCGTTPVLVSPGGADTIEGATGLSANINGAYILLVYNSATTNWKLADTYANTYSAAPAPAPITTSFPGSNATPLTGVSRYYFSASATYTTIIVGLSSALTSFTITIYKNGSSSATLVYSGAAAYTSSGSISLSVISGDYITVGAVGSGALFDLVVTLK